MKSKKNLTVHMLGVLLIALSHVIVCTVSFGLIGEPNPPKSLLK